MAFSVAMRLYWEDEVNTFKESLEKCYDNYYCILYIFDILVKGKTQSL